MRKECGSIPVMDEPMGHRATGWIAGFDQDARGFAGEKRIVIPGIAVELRADVTDLFVPGSYCFRSDLRTGSNARPQNKERTGSDPISSGAHKHVVTEPRRKFRDFKTFRTGGTFVNMRFSLARPISFFVAIALPLLAGIASAQEHIVYPSVDGTRLAADLYGTGERGLVLAHGGRFNKESWAKQALVFANAGYRVLAVDFRGYG